MVVLFIGVLLCAIVRKRGCGSVREGSRRFRDPPDRAGHAWIGSVQPFLFIWYIIYYEILWYNIYIMTYIVIPLIEQATHRSGQCNRSNIITVLRTGESELFNFWTTSSLLFCTIWYIPLPIMLLSNWRFKSLHYIRLTIFFFHIPNTCHYYHSYLIFVAGATGIPV